MLSGNEIVIGESTNRNFCMNVDSGDVVYFYAASSACSADDAACCYTCHT